MPILLRPSLSTLSRNPLGWHRRSGAQNSILFDNAFYVTSGTSLLRTEFDGVTTPVANYSGIGVTGFHHNIDPGREGMILNVNTVNQTESVNLEVDAGGNVIRTWNLAEIISAAMIAGGDDPSQFVYPAPPIGFTTTPAPTAALKVKEANPR